MKKLFRRKKNNGRAKVHQVTKEPSSKQLKSEAVVSDFYLVIDGAKVKPVLNDEIIYRARYDMAGVVEKHPDGKFKNVLQTNFMVYYAIMEGIKRLGLKKEYTIFEIFSKINFEDYVRVLQVYKDTKGNSLLDISMQN